MAAPVRLALTTLLGLTLIGSPALAAEGEGGGDAPAAAEGAKTKIVVYKLQAEEGLESLAEQISDEILLHLAKQAGLTVIGESEIQVMLSHEKDKSTLMCEDEQRCLAKLSEAIQAEKVITGRLGKLGATHLITLKLADAARAVVEGGESAEAEKPAELRNATLEAVDRLLGLAEGGAAAKFEMEIGEEGVSAAVIDLDPHGVPDSLGDSLTQLLSLELKKYKGLSVISRDEIQTMLRFQADKQVLQCKSDTSCLVEIGGALGVDYLVSGSVGQLGDAYVVTLKLMDVHEARVVNRASETFRGPETELATVLRVTASMLLGASLGGNGTLMVRANVDEGELSLDGAKPVAFPITDPFGDVLAGKHAVNLRSEGYYPLYQETYVLGGQQTMLRLSLEEIPVPWYKQWWPWTALGVVMAGGVTAVMLANQEEPAGSVSVTIKGSEE